VKTNSARQKLNSNWKILGIFSSISLFAVSLTPDFSPVDGWQTKPSRFNGLARGETVETVLGPHRIEHPAEAGC
jgi:hypothetical protein